MSLECSNLKGYLSANQACRAEMGRDSPDIAASHTAFAGGQVLRGVQVRWVAGLAECAGLGGLRILEGVGLGGVIGFSQSFSKIGHLAVGHLTSCASLTTIREP